VFPPPPIPGLGNAAGFAMQVEALGGQSEQDLTQVLKGLIATAKQDPRIANAYSTFSADNPQLFLDLDRTKASTWMCRCRRCSTPCSRSSAPPM
jgi:multidrug efflux pump subunit AcrB